jgi:hypothetical protein
MTDYWLKDSTSAPVSIEIADASGNIVRRLSSADKPETVNPKDFNVPMYWVRPSQTVSAVSGMHRFVWDLTYPAPDVLSRDFPISAIYHDTPLYPQGATVLPGKYTVKLTTGGKTETQPLEIRMDPRVKTSPEDLRRQFELDRKIADALHRDYEALQQVRSLRAQLKALAGKNPSPQTKAAADALETKLAALEGDEGGYGTRFFSTPEGRSLARLNTGFNMLLSALDTADAAPTSQQSATFGDLDKALEEQLATWNQIKAADVPALNQQLNKAGMPLLDLNAPIVGGGAQVSSQNRDRDVE